MTIVPLLTGAKVAAIAPNLNLGCPPPPQAPESCSLINFHDHVHDTGEPIQLDTSPNTTRHLFPSLERRPHPSSTPRPKRSPNSGPSANVVVRHLVAPLRLPARSPTDRRCDLDSDGPKNRRETGSETCQISQSKLDADLQIGHPPFRTS